MFHFGGVMKKLHKLCKKITTTMVFAKVIVIFLPIYVFGFALDDHKELSKIAIKEFFRCIQPEMLHASNESALNSFNNIIIDGNLQEDTNYLSKMLQYSHFYNPYFYVNVKWLHVFDRCPSNYRIYHLEQILDAYLKGDEIDVSNFLWDSDCQPTSILQITESTNQFLRVSSNIYSASSLDFKLFHANDTRQTSKIHEQYFYWLGHAIHHLQDMSSPTHVVPILHPIAFDSPASWEFIPYDGFEDNNNRIPILNQIASELDHQTLDKTCDFKQSTPQTLFDILDQSARSTLDALTQEVLIHILKPENNRRLQSFYSPLYLARNERFIPITVTWEKWYDRRSAVNNTNHLGQYGVYQDSFGLTKFQLDRNDPQTPQNEEGWTIYVSREFYDLFTYQQYRQAIEDTKKALYYGYLHVSNPQQYPAR